MDLLEVPKTSFRRHPWEVARARFFRDLLGRSGVMAHASSILDVGAGDGYLANIVAERMPSEGRVVCFDPLYTNEDISRFSADTAARLTFTRLRPQQQFDVALLLDVVEHVEDDREFLGGFVSSNVKPGGSVLVSVPAWQALFTQHDVTLKHYRRYSPQLVMRLLEDANLRVVKSGGLFHGPLLPRALTALRESFARIFGQTSSTPANLGDWRGGPMLSDVAERLLFADNFVSAKAADFGWSLPGLSFWALCEKPTHP